MRSVCFGVVAVSAAALVGVGCAAGTRSDRSAAVGAPSHAAKAMFERVKTLEGTWEMVDEKGERHVAATFTVSSNGTIVREVMFPGGAHEMTNIYHMDGPTLLLTHYCAMGNQPRMRARELRADQIAFAHDSVTNLDSPETAYMGEMTLVFTGPDTVLQEWRSIANGTRDASHDVSIRLTRRR